MKVWKIIAPLLVASVLAGQSAARAETLPETIRFAGFGQGFGKPHGLGLLAIAQGKGFIEEAFKDSPVKLSFEYLTGTGPAVNEGIASGRIDFAQYGGLPNIVGKAAGLPTRVLVSYGRTTIYGVALADQPIQSFKDLKGKRVGVSKGTILHWALLKGLELEGLGLKDIRLIDLKTADQLAALSAGTIDASVNSSTVLPLRDKNIVKVFYDGGKPDAKVSAFGGILVTEDFEKKYPEATQRVTTALVRAAHWVSDEANREEAIALWARSGVAESSLREEYADIRLKDVFNPVPDAYFVSLYHDATAFSKEQKLIRSDIDFAQWFAPAYAANAIQALSLDGFWAPRPAL